MTRQFTSSPAKRARVPLLIGLAGPSGSGKTYSALRLATGIKRATPGDIYVIDTEAGRALHYADEFKFHHVPFAAPFGCFDYLEAIRYCVERGASTIVIDSASHLHEGEGGMLDQHEQAIDRATKGSTDWAARDAASWRCWKQPKADMNRFVQCLLQLNTNMVFCFRAKDRVKPGMQDGKKALISQGTMAIADDSLIYEMTVQPLLEAGSRGVPNWNPTERGAALQTKLPGFFADILQRKGQPLDENMGELMGRWAAGDSPSSTPKAQHGANPGAVTLDGGKTEGVPRVGDPIAVMPWLDEITAATDTAAVMAIQNRFKAVAASFSEAHREQMRQAIRERNRQLQA